MKGTGVIAFGFMATIALDSVEPLHGALMASGAGVVGWMCYGCWRVTSDSMSSREFFGQIPLAGLAGLICYAFVQLPDFIKLLAWCAVSGTIAAPLISAAQKQILKMMGDDSAKK